MDHPFPDLRERQQDALHRYLDYHPCVQQVDRSTAVGALAAEYGLLTKIITALRQSDLLQPSGCLGWTNADLIFHMLLDAQRALVTFNSPAIGPVDRNFVTYWNGFLATDGSSQEHARYVRINAASHRDPTRICSRWGETAEAAIRSSQTANIDLVTTQGHILNIADFIATLVVEATIHHLDLVANLADRAAPAPQGVQITTMTIDGLLKAPRPLDWSDETYILKATGRAPLMEEDRTALGSAGQRIPVFS
jgi:Mycothiol maleylpyruvate isomerase N-terminal domain